LSASSIFGRSEGVSFYNPNVENWSPRMIRLEYEAKAHCDLMLYVISSETRAVASMVEVCVSGGGCVDDDDDDGVKFAGGPLYR
jgi:hypothetical protein